MQSKLTEIWNMNEGENKEPIHWCDIMMKMKIKRKTQIWNEGTWMTIDKIRCLKNDDEPQRKCSTWPRRASTARLLSSTHVPKWISRRSKNDTMPKRSKCRANTLIYARIAECRESCQRVPKPIKVLIAEGQRTKSNGIPISPGDHIRAEKRAQTKDTRTGV